MKIKIESRNPNRFGGPGLAIGSSPSSVLRTPFPPGRRGEAERPSRFHALWAAPNWFPHYKGRCKWTRLKSGGRHHCRPVRARTFYPARGFERVLIGGGSGRRAGKPGSTAAMDGRRHGARSVSGEVQNSLAAKMAILTFAKSAKTPAKGHLVNLGQPNILKYGEPRMNDKGEQAPIAAQSGKPGFPGRWKLAGCFQGVADPADRRPGIRPADWMKIGLSKPAVFGI